MSSEDRTPAGPPGPPRLLGRDYWLVLSTPVAGTSQADIDACAGDHISWLLGLERDGVLFLSGPLLSGPGTGPGSGVTVLRAADAGQAGAIAAKDPFVLARSADLRRAPLAAQRGQHRGPALAGRRDLRLAITGQRTARRRRCTESD